MNKIIKIKFLNILVTSAMVMIYFQIYWHYWFVKLLGGYVVNTCLPVILIFSVFIFRELLFRDDFIIKRRSIYYFLIPLFCYTIFALISIFLNEQGFDKIKSYFIYVLSPMLIFVSILGLWIYKKNENISSFFKVLFIIGVILSIYVVVTYSINPAKVLDMPILETNRGNIIADTGGTFGVGNLGAVRYTIPGMSSTTYGPILVPLIFVGLYFRKNYKGKIKYFYTLSILFLVFCVLRTVSRGPLLALIAGMMYLSIWKWFKMREFVFVMLALIISFGTFAKLAFLRLVVTFGELINADVLNLGVERLKITDDPRLMSIKETLLYIYKHPFFGMGMFNLEEAQKYTYGKEHNNYLSIAASFGIPALVFYILFLTLFFLLLHKRIKNLSQNSTSRDMGIVLGAGYLGLIVYLNFAPAEFHFIWIWFGLVAAWLRNSEYKLSLR